MASKIYPSSVMDNVSRSDNKEAIVQTAICRLAMLTAPAPELQDGEEQS